MGERVAGKIVILRVEVAVDQDQVEQLKALVEDVNARGPSASFRDWRDYARTLTRMGFAERVIRRFAELRDRQLECQRRGECPQPLATQEASQC